MHKLCFLFILIAFQCYAECPPGAVYNPVNERCYKAFAKTQTFNGAEKVCNEYDGHLVSIKGPNENNVIQQAAAFTPDMTDLFWVGLHNVSNSWTWIDGDTYWYNNWAKGQPNRTEPCVLIQEYGGQWLTENCNARHSFMCLVPQIE